MFLHTLTLVLSIVGTFHLPPQKQVACMAKNIYHEARGEPIIGKLAVANVTINRVRADGFPDTICEVVYQKNKRGCQFSWTCNPKAVIKEHDAYRSAVELSRLILIMQAILPDVTNGALHYHTKYVHPKWGFSVLADIGNHVFVGTK